MADEWTDQVTGWRRLGRRGLLAMGVAPATVMPGGPSPAAAWIREVSGWQRLGRITRLGLNLAPSRAYPPPAREPRRRPTLVFQTAFVVLGSGGAGVVLLPLFSNVSTVAGLICGLFFGVYANVPWAVREWRLGRD